MNFWYRFLKTHVSLKLIGFHPKITFWRPKSRNKHLHHVLYLRNSCCHEDDVGLSDPNIIYV